MRLAEVFEKLNRVNDGTRALLESMAIPEIEQALRDWIYSEHEGKGVLIGGCAASYYGRPRATTDVDVLYTHIDDIPNSVPKFKRTRSGAFQHNNTHAEVEVISPQTINIDAKLAQKVYDTSIKVDNYRVASPSGIVALKLQRLKNNDIGDIVAMINTDQVDLDGWPLSAQNLADYDEILTRFV
jgi:hypothetical protein